MKKFPRVIFSCLLFIIPVLIIYLNVRLYYKPSFNSNETEINTDLLKQLHFLKSSLHDGAADEMQQVYPEGFIFMQAVYGLSWADVAKASNHNSKLRNEAQKEIQWAYSEVQSGKGRDRFDQTLPLPYGTYYTGWSNYLLGKKLSIERPEERDSLEVLQFSSTCKEIDSIIKTTVYPESYKGYSWPADVCVAVASLSLHDQILKPMFQQTIREWLAKVKIHKDVNGFIPYATVPGGKPIEMARGSSESLILNFLIDIDTAFAREQFDLYKYHFLDSSFGLPGIREFPKGTKNTGDVDSGPVVFDMGSAATIVGMRVLALYGDSTNAVAIRNGIEAFGFPFRSRDQKKYLFGKWPMADVFIAWSHSTEITKDKELHASENWKYKFQLYSLILLIAFAIPLRLLLKKPRKS
jgi:hypothetical protein